MNGDDPKILELPKAEIAPEERARRLKVEVERLAGLPAVERLFYIESDGVAEKHGVSRAVLKEMVEATIRANEKKAREDKAEDRQRIRRVEKNKVTAQRELAREQAKQKREQEQADKEAELVRTILPPIEFCCWPNTCSTQARTFESVVFADFWRSDSG